MRLRVLHTTRYLYSSPAINSYNEARLMPLSDDDQTCLDFRLSVTPPARVFAYDSAWGRVHHFNMRAPHRELAIRAEALVVTHRANPFSGLQLIADDRGFYARPDIRQTYFEYLQPTTRVPLPPETDRIAAVARKQAGVGTASFLIALTRLLHRAFTFAPGATTIHTSLLEVLENKQGVCQDFAHLMLSVCRRQGIPARYVSGYLFTGEATPEFANVSGGANKFSQSEWEREDRGGNVALDTLPTLNDEEEELVGGNAMHAWVECLMPDGKWRGFDPTNNLVTNEYYVKSHYGRDYGDVLPVRGLYRGPSSHMEVAVRVRREPDLQ